MPEIDARLKSILAQVDAAKKKTDKPESSEHAARVCMPNPDCPFLSLRVWCLVVITRVVSCCHYA